MCVCVRACMHVNVCACILNSLTPLHDYLYACECLICMSLKQLSIVPCVPQHAGNHCLLTDSISLFAHTRVRVCVRAHTCSVHMDA